MKNAYSIFTKTRLGLDVRVWITFFLFLIIAVAILGFKIATTVVCTPFEIFVNSVTATKDNSYYIGETVIFKTTISAKKISWDFGDHTKAEGARVNHSFLHEGSYVVTVLVNDQCTQAAAINIKPFTTKKTDEANPVTIQINGPDAPNAGEPVNYVSAVPATSYAWTILNSPNFKIQTTNTATYNFPSPGTRIIELKLDNDPKKVIRKKIVVTPSEKIQKNTSPIIVVPPVIKPKPTPPANTQPPASQPAAPQPQVTAPPPAVTKTVPVIPNQLLQGIFEDIIAGKKDVQSLNEYLCSGMQTKVFANGQLETIQSICSKLHSKKYELKSVTADRDEKKCVTVIRIDYKKKGLFH